MTALQAIFDLVAALIDPSKAANVRILRLEYGSFLAVLAVTGAILKIARPWISALAGFFHRTRTFEGSLDSTTKSAAAIKQALDVRKLFEKNGIATDKMDAEFEAAGAAMVANVTALIGSQIRFKIDGEEFRSTRADLPLENRIIKQLPPPSGS